MPQKTFGADPSKELVDAQQGRRHAGDKDQGDSNAHPFLVEGAAHEQVNQEDLHPLQSLLDTDCQRQGREPGDN